MKKTGITLQAGASVVQGPRGKNLEFIWKNTQLGIRTEGDTEYDYVDLQGQQGIRGIQGNKGDTGNGIDKIENIFFSDKTKTYRITFTNGSFFDFSVENGENVYDIALDNGFEGTEEEWLLSLIGPQGRSLEFVWNGTELGVRVEGEDTYTYTNLKGEKGPKGEKGDKGDKGEVSVVSKNDGITINGNDIQLNTVDNLINTSITKPLSANQGVILDKQDKGVLGGYNGIFPLTVASKNGIYLLPATNKFYVCVENYNGTNLTAPNANFEELSVFQNRNKLENLKEYKVLFEDENFKLYKINENIGFVFGYVEIDFSKLEYAIQVGNLYKYYGNIGIPQEIYSKLYNYNYSMVTTYISNAAHHSVVHHTFMGDGITSPIDNQGGVWEAEIGFLAPLVQDI